MKKRILPLVLAAILCLNLVSNAFAADEGHWDYSDPDNGPQWVEPGGGDEGGGNEGGGDEGGGDEGGGNEGGGNQGGGNDPGTTNPPDYGYDDDDDDDDNDRHSHSSSSSSSSSSTTTTTTPTQPTTTTPTEPNTSWTTPTFYDVPSREWYYQAVTYVATNGIMSGNGNNFAPNDRLTRGMMAQILYNMEKATAAGTASFPDVSASDWFANAAAWASSQGYMSGYSNGRFGPNDPITREQLAAILYRYAQAKGYDVSAGTDLSTFIDGASTSDWAVSAVRWAVASGLLSGKTGVGGSRLDPTGNATRAEVAQILMNFATKVAK